MQSDALKTLPKQEQRLKSQQSAFFPYRHAPHPVSLGEGTGMYISPFAPQPLQTEDRCLSFDFLDQKIPSNALDGFPNVLLCSSNKGYNVLQNRKSPPMDVSPAECRISPQETLASSITQPVAFNKEIIRNSFIPSKEKWASIPPCTTTDPNSGLHQSSLNEAQERETIVSQDIPTAQQSFHIATPFNHEMEENDVTNPTEDIAIRSLHHAQNNTRPTLNFKRSDRLQNVSYEHLSYELSILEMDKVMSETKLQESLSPVDHFLEIETDPFTEIRALKNADEQVQTAGAPDACGSAILPAEPVALETRVCKQNETMTEPLPTSTSHGLRKSKEKGIQSVADIPSPVITDPTLSMSVSDGQEDADMEDEEVPPISSPSKVLPAPPGTPAPEIESERAKIEAELRVNKTTFCNLCNKAFKRKKDRLRHLQRMHILKGRYPCPHTPCKQSFAEAHKLARHVQTVHLLKRPYKCSQCDSSFGERGNMMQHFRKAHNGEVRDRKKAGSK